MPQLNPEHDPSAQRISRQRFSALALSHRAAPAKRVSVSEG